LISFDNVLVESETVATFFNNAVFVGAFIVFFIVLVDFLGFFTKLY